VRFELKLAWTYFRARRKSTARFTAIVAIAGIACGVASLIIVQALTRGFASEMQEKILSNTAHITIFQTNSREIQNWQIVKREIEKIENIREVTPTSYENALIISEKATSHAVLRVWSRESGVESQNPQTPDSRLQTPDSVVLGAELAEKTGLKAGDEAEIVLPSNEYLPQTKTVRVADIFRTGIYDYDATWIYISPENFARVFEQNVFTPTVLSVAVRDVYAADETARKIREMLPPHFKVVDWQEANQPLFAALSMEKKVSLAIISLIIFIAALNITTTLALLVNERKLDIAVLRTCGARARSLILIFLLEGLFLGVIGIFAGVILGLSLCFAGNYFEVINLPSEVYSLSYVPLVLNPGDIFFIVAIAFLLCLIATIYPAWRASQIKPLDNLRDR
jgi:lipoprotein-releasing system permease protein